MTRRSAVRRHSRGGRSRAKSRNDRSGGALVARRLAAAVPFGVPATDRDSDRAVAIAAEVLRVASLRSLRFAGLRVSGLSQRRLQAVEARADIRFARAEHLADFAVRVSFQIEEQ